ncbi:hypothetical protein DA2_0763 [Desulfovibrio sp. A2]|nr:hypothetical protein DA2_0763 [Desulfovibrio sp. A2]
MNGPARRAGFRSLARCPALVTSLSPSPPARPRPAGLPGGLPSATALAR